MSVLLTTTTPNSGDGTLHITNTEVDENTLINNNNLVGNTLFNSKLFNTIKIINTYSFQLDGSYNVFRLSDIGGNYPDHYCPIPSSSGFVYGNYSAGQNVIIGVVYDPVSKYQLLLNGCICMEINISAGQLGSSSSMSIGFGLGFNASQSNTIVFDTASYTGGMLFNNRTSLLFKVYVLDIGIVNNTVTYNSNGSYSDVELSNAGMKINGTNLSDKMFLTASILKAGSYATYSSSSEAGLASGTSGFAYITSTFGPSDNSIRISNDFFPLSFDKNSCRTRAILSKNSFITEYLYNGLTYKSTLGVEKVLPGYEGYDAQRHITHYKSVSTMTGSQTLTYSGDYVLFCVLYTVGSSVPTTVLVLNPTVADASYLVGISTIASGMNPGSSLLYLTKSGNTYSMHLTGIGTYINYTQKCTIFEYCVN